MAIYWYNSYLIKSELLAWAARFDLLANDATASGGGASATCIVTGTGTGTGTRLSCCGQYKI